MIGTPRLGIILMISATFVFACQDGISRHLAGTYNVYMVVMIRYWFFALFVIALVARQPGGLRKALGTTQPILQIFRGVLLVVEVLVNIMAFVLLGLVEAHAIFASYPLMIAALSGPVLGETVGWRRWGAIIVGFIGVLIILRPGTGVFTAASLTAVAAALMFALYGLLTRYAARRDSAMTSFFWTGIAGAVVATAVGVWHWEPMNGPDWAWMSLLCVTGALGHYLLIKTYEVAEANSVQPFAFTQLVFAALIGVAVFSDVVEMPVIIGGAIVVAAGIFTAIRARANAA